MNVRSDLARPLKRRIQAQNYYGRRGLHDFIFVVAIVLCNKPCVYFGVALIAIHYHFGALRPSCRPTTRPVSFYYLRGQLTMLDS